MALTRRAFIASGAALTFVVGNSGILQAASAEAGQMQGLDANAWVRIDPDDTITIVFPSTEMGQGSSSALPLILAEELDADWDRVEIEQLNRDDRTFGNPIFGGVLYTAGSTGVYGYFDSLRKAGAQARRMLMQRAAGEWSVSLDSLTTEPGLVVHAASGRRLSYGALAALPGPLPSIPEVSEADFKARADYRLIGQNVPRRDVPAKSSGRERYAIDVQVPDMLYAAVLRSPVEGETPLEIDDSEALDVPGVLQTVTLPDGVAVVAERLEAAFIGKDSLDVTWSETAPARAFDSETDLTAYTAAAGDAARDGVAWRSVGDAPLAIDNAAKVVEADYLSDYAYHAQIEPMAAVAAVDSDGRGAEVWVGSQTQSWTMRTITEVLEATPERIRLHMMTMGGSFGRRTALTQEYLRDALLTSKALGRPVKVVWSREDDVKHGAFRPAAAQRLRAGLTADGKLSGWHHRIATPSVIAYFNPLRWDQVAPTDIISVRGSESKFYAIDGLLAEHVITERRARLAPWRGIGASYTSFAAEAFMDELAAAAGQDGLTFRLALMGDNTRGRRLLEKVAERAGWGRPPGETALGLSFAGYGDSMAAGIAEVALDRDSGSITVQRFWAAVDAGLIISPDNALAQIEGGIVFGLSSSLKESITIQGGEVVQNNYYDYEILRADEVPEIDIHLEVSDGPPTGIGEVGTPMVAAAVANAFYALTGKRLRRLPFTPERVTEALA
ncbi:xanthine dehydrogenase family protein molybdopterin-binding subunit [Pelagibius litoralis]|uniref:Xanthine dehydrogenase family protein molybdopterin-binding subunit n=1 Tax=Pelagibius litoralis TaxID=374515 RepID=A0A967F1D4_9PROT|nr:molybdopterin cofactor-binding domain-containing protein [Pelagibius litoralis]NIA71170.1 xanthine dehydrogenase family protein molybdopterin-binding subunit [Pelagibius litoralis]